MSILATNLGFSAAITNPFTIGVAQELAGLPLFSGSWFRIPIFIAIYAVFAFFLTRYAKKVERHPEASLYTRRPGPTRKIQTPGSFTAIRDPPAMNRYDLLPDLPDLDRGYFDWRSFYFLSVRLRPAAGRLFFLVGGVGAGLISSEKRRNLESPGEGIGGIAPGFS